MPPACQAHPKAEPVQKITIVPRTMGALGYVMQVPEEEKYLMKKDELETRLIMLLAPRAAIIAASLIIFARSEPTAPDVARAIYLTP